MVVAGVLPIDLIAQERAELEEGHKNGKHLDETKKDVRTIIEIA